MLVDAIARSWKQARESLIAELEQIPADKFEFRATPETRTVVEIVKHALGAQKVFVSGVCSSGADMKRAAVFAGINRYQDEIAHINDKDGLIALLKDNMKWAQDTINAFGDEGLQEITTRMDGAKVHRFELINFIIAHEMYHTGQIAVYERLLGTEPALTTRFNKVMAEAAQK